MSVNSSFSEPSTVEAKTTTIRPTTTLALTAMTAARLVQTTRTKGLAAMTVGAVQADTTTATAPAGALATTTTEGLLAGAPGRTCFGLDNI